MSIKSVKIKTRNDIKKKEISIEDDILKIGNANYLSQAIDGFESKDFELEKEYEGTIYKLIHSLDNSIKKLWRMILKLNNRVRIILLGITTLLAIIAFAITGEYFLLTLFCLFIVFLVFFIIKVCIRTSKKSRVYYGILINLRNKDIFFFLKSRKERESFERSLRVFLVSRSIDRSITVHGSVIDSTLITGDENQIQK